MAEVPTQDNPFGQPKGIPDLDAVISAAGLEPEWMRPRIKRAASASVPCPSVPKAVLPLHQPDRPALRP